MSSFDVESPSKKKKGVYCSTCCVWTTVIFVVAALVAEGLLVGLVARPSCATVDPTKEPTEETTPEPSLPTAGPPPDVPSFLLDHRLRPNLIPIDYTLSLRPVFKMVDDTYYYYGSSTVDFRCDIPTDTIVLNSKYLDQFDTPLLSERDSGKKVEYVEGPLFFAPQNFIYFTLAGDCEQGMVYHLEFPKFRGELNADLDGFYRSTSKDENGEQIIIATSQMETEGARRTFPCFDEPEYKAEFQITMIYQEPYMSVTNMPEISRETVMIDGESWTSTTYENSPKMSTYLLAMTVTDFGNVEAYTVNGTQTKIFARKTPVNNGEVDYAGDISPIVLDTFSVYLKEPYPLPKSDQMCVPDFDAGAMENWGLVIYRETYLLYDNKTGISGVNDQYRIVSVIAHELAHQWFGNLVTCSYWNEIWLNEGFATYFSYIGVYGVYPYWTLDEYFVYDDFQRALYADDSSGSHPLLHQAGLFSTVTYSKGASILRMVRNFLGEDTFVTAIQNYLDDMAYDIATYKDLLGAWIDQAEADGVAPYGLNLFDIIESWIVQMGFPMLTVTKSGNQITVSQEIFLIDPADTPATFENEEADKYNYQWYVPFSYTKVSELDGTNKPTYQWLALEKSMTIDTNEDILANVGAVGFYRVNYDAGMWKTLTEKLASNFQEISVQNRAQLIDDAFAIARASKLDIEVPLGLSQYLDQEHDYFPWTVFYDDIFYYTQMLGTSPIYGYFSDWVLSLAVPGLYAEYGFVENDVSDQAFFERKARGLGVEIGCYFGAPDCIANATTMYKNWMNNPTQLISATYRSDIYCAAIANGGVAEWDFAWDQYLKSDSAQHQQSLRYGMSCSRDAWIINRYIDYASDNTLVRYQDQYSTFSYIGRHESNKYVVWAYATNNYDKLYGAVGGTFSSMLSYAKNRFSTSFDLKVIEDFREVAGSNWDRTLDSYKYTVEKNMQWRAANEDRIAAWLNVPSDVRSDRSLFIIDNPTPRPEMDEDMYVGSKHMRPSNRRGDRP